ncbi:hypothetical protein ACFQZK_00545 [Rhodococcus aetherivorans]
MLTFDDTAGRERLHLETPGGQMITLGDGPGVITVRDGNGNTVTLAASGVSIECAVKVTVNASTVDISAGSVTVNAGMARFSGVIQADAVITNSIVSASYSPGAGNMW